MQWPHLSTEVLPLLAIVSPLIGMMTAIVVARWNKPLLRPMALSNALTTILLVVGMLVIYNPDQQHGKSGTVRQMQSATPWLQKRPALDRIAEADSALGVDVRLSLGVDGLCAWSALLLTITVWAALCFPGRLRDDLFGAYCAWIMLSETLLLASLFSTDAITTLVLIEAALLPMYVLVGVCGGDGRRKAAGAMWIWQFVGCSCSLFGVTLLAVSRSWMQSDLVPRRGPLLFDSLLLTESVQHLLMRSETAIRLWSDVAPWACLFLMLGFAIRLPVFPFHGWYESALSVAPAGAAALIAAVFPMISLNGWLRTVSPSFLESEPVLTGLLGTFSIVGLWRAGLVAYQQTDLLQLLATISAGLMCLSSASLNTQHHDGIRGALLMALSQGLAIAIAILATEMVQQRCGTREISQLGSIVRVRPRLASVLIISLIGFAGMPFLWGFASLTLIFYSAAGTSMLLLISEVVALALLASSVLRAIGCCLTDSRGLTTWDGNDGTANWPAREPDGGRYRASVDNDSEPLVPGDLSLRELVTFAPLLLLLISLNLIPSAVLDGCEPTLRRLTRPMERVSDAKQGLGIRRVADDSGKDN